MWPQQVWDQGQVSVCYIHKLWRQATQAIDIIFQVWEHAQKSKNFLPNKAYFLILLRIVFNFLNKNSLFHALFLHFKYYKN